MLTEAPHNITLDVEHTEAEDALFLISGTTSLDAGTLRRINQEKKKTLAGMSGLSVLQFMQLDAQFLSGFT